MYMYVFTVAQVFCSLSKNLVFLYTASVMTGAYRDGLSLASNQKYSILYLEIKLLLLSC